MSKKMLHNLKQCSAPEMNIYSVTLDDEPQDEEDEEAEREQVEHVVSVAARQKPSDLRKQARVWLNTNDTIFIWRLYTCIS